MITSEERANSYEAAIASAIKGDRAGLWTAMPAQIVKFDPARQVASAQITIQLEQTFPDGTTKPLTFPLLPEECPVHFPKGGGCTLTFPVAAGDECLAVIANRCIDAWWQAGGVQPQDLFRMHDLSDAFLLVGFSSLPNVIADISTTATELRSDDGATKIALDPTAQTLVLTAPGGIMLDGPVTGTSTADFADDVTADGTSVHTHKHTGGTISGDTGVPI